MINNLNQSLKSPSNNISLSKNCLKEETKKNTYEDKTPTLRTQLLKPKLLNFKKKKTVKTVARRKG